MLTHAARACCLSALLTAACAAKPDGGGVAHLVDVGGGRGDLALCAAATLPRVRATCG